MAGSDMVPPAFMVIPSTTTDEAKGNVQMLQVRMMTYEYFNRAMMMAEAETDSCETQVDSRELGYHRDECSQTEQKKFRDNSCTAIPEQADFGSDTKPETQQIGCNTGEEEVRSVVCNTISKVVPPTRPVGASETKMEQKPNKGPGPEDKPKDPRLNTQSEDSMRKRSYSVDVGPNEGLTKKRGKQIEFMGIILGSHLMDLKKLFESISHDHPSRVFSLTEKYLDHIIDLSNSLPHENMDRIMARDRDMMKRFKQNPMWKAVLGNSKHAESPNEISADNRRLSKSDEDGADGAGEGSLAEEKNAKRRLPTGIALPNVRLNEEDRRSSAKRRRTEYLKLGSRSSGLDSDYRRVDFPEQGSRSPSRENDENRTKYSNRNSRYAPRDNIDGPRDPSIRSVVKTPSPPLSSRCGPSSTRPMREPGRHDPRVLSRPHRPPVHGRSCDESSRRGTRERGSPPLSRHGGVRPTKSLDRRRSSSDRNGRSKSPVRRDVRPVRHTDGQRDRQRDKHDVPMRKVQVQSNAKIRIRKEEKPELAEPRPPPTPEKPSEPPSCLETVLSTGQNEEDTPIGLSRLWSVTSEVSPSSSDFSPTAPTESPPMSPGEIPHTPPGSPRPQERAELLEPGPEDGRPLTPPQGRRGPLPSDPNTPVRDERQRSDRVTRGKWRPSHGRGRSYWQQQERAYYEQQQNQHYPGASKISTQITRRPSRDDEFPFTPPNEEPGLLPTSHSQYYAPELPYDQHYQHHTTDLRQRLPSQQRCSKPSYHGYHQ